MSEVAQRLKAVQDRIAKACERGKRDPSTVKLIAVSKLQSVELIREAYAAGQRDFGENYAQELRDKSAELADLKDIRWHAIGPLQSNKAKYIAKQAFAFHAVENLNVAQELSKRRSLPKLKLFIEVNVGGELTKSGVAPTEARGLYDEVRALPNLEVVGLMALPPLADDLNILRPYFRKLRAVAQQLGLKELSTGTTADFEVAIEEGATYVRIGTAIFGARES